MLKIEPTHDQEKKNKFSRCTKDFTVVIVYTRYTQYKVIFILVEMVIYIDIFEEFTTMTHFIN